MSSPLVEDRGYLRFQGLIIKVELNKTALVNDRSRFCWAKFSEAPNINYPLSCFVVLMGMRLVLASSALGICNVHIPAS
jgi:hypothetical protein